MTKLEKEIKGMLAEAEAKAGRSLTDLEIALMLVSIAKEMEG